MLSRRTLLKSLLGFTLAGIFTAFYGSVVEAGLRLRVQRWAIQPVAWPRGHKLRIVMLADLHAGAPQMSEARIQQIVALANKQGGDLVLLMGDYRASHMFQSHQVPIEMSAEILAQLDARLGVHAIIGNHDWRDDPVAQQRRTGPTNTEMVLNAAGINVLVNRAVHIDDGTAGFWLTGVDSQQAVARPDPDGRQGRDDLAGTLAQVTTDGPVILLAHEPDIFAEMPARVALTLSGHTHGGQIRIGNWTPVVPSKFGSRYVYGHIIERDRDLVVSGGLGCSAIPVRIGRPPEITVIDLS